MSDKSQSTSNNTEGLTKLTIGQVSQSIDNDDTLKARFAEDARNNWNKNSEQYNKLLENYVKNAEGTLFDKRFQKKCFFGISMTILFIAIIFSLYAINAILISDAETSSKIIEIIPLVITFLTPLLVIPNAIVNYLFTTKDEEHMIMIIEQIIKHDDSSLKG